MLSGRGQMEHITYVRYQSNIWCYLVSSATWCKPKMDSRQKWHESTWAWNHIVFSNSWRHTRIVLRTLNSTEIINTRMLPITCLPLVERLIDPTGFWCIKFGNRANFCKCACPAGLSGTELRSDPECPPAECDTLVSTCYSEKVGGNEVHTCM